MLHYKLNRKLKGKLCKLGVLTKVLNNMKAEGDFIELDLTHPHYSDIRGLFNFNRSKEGKEFWYNIASKM